MNLSLENEWNVRRDDGGANGNYMEYAAFSAGISDQGAIDALG